MALGAGRPEVIHLVMREALVLTAVGLGVGLVSALALTRLLRTLLFQVTPTDPSTLVLVSCLVAVAAALAAYSPALRATKINPVQALRYE